MTFRLPRLPAFQPPWGIFQLWWQRVVEQIEAEENAQNKVIDNLRRMLSHTNPTTVITAVDNGSTATITIADHVRVYGDGTTVNITGGAPHTGMVSNTVYAVYYDDTTLSDTAPTIILTTDIPTAQAAVAPGRHFLGVITTPAAASGRTYTGGGAYPPGSSVGGEV